MRNLILLLWRNNFFIYFILLETLCFYLIVQYNNYQKVSFINSSSAVVGKTYDSMHSVTSYLGLKKKNERLAIENASMRNRMKESYLAINARRITKIDSLAMKQYEFTEAAIINNSINRRNNYITLNKGSKQGIKPEMGVVNSDGVVGIINGVSKNYCTVMSVLHKDSRISAQIKKNSYFGSLVWEGTDPKMAVLKEIPTHVKLSVGDSIVTSSFSAIFPQGVPIGTIKSFELTGSKDFYKIDVELSVDYQSLSDVYIVNNMLKIEQEELEAENAE